MPKIDGLITVLPAQQGFYLSDIIQWPSRLRPWLNNASAKIWAWMRLGAANFFFHFRDNHFDLWPAWYSIHIIGQLYMVTSRRQWISGKLCSKCLIKSSTRVLQTKSMPLQVILIRLSWVQMMTIISTFSLDERLSSTCWEDKAKVSGYRKLCFQKNRKRM